MAAAKMMEGSRLAQDFAMKQQIVEFAKVLGASHLTVTPSSGIGAVILDQSELAPPRPAVAAEQQ